MKNISILTSFLFALLLSNCSSDKKYEKGFSIGPETEMSDDNKIDGINKDSINFKTRASSVLITGFPNYRLTTIYKLNYYKKEDSYFIGYTHFYRNYTDFGQTNGNQWNYNFMPGLEAVYGYNLVNVSLYNIEQKKHKYLFDNHVLIKTVYFPSFSSDTLNHSPVQREYYMISVYNEDTNKDGFINLKDLRRFYTFDLNGENKNKLIPENYSVISSEYDSANDYMYVFAQLDENNNGQKDDIEDIHVFWIDLKNPNYNGRLY